MSATGALNPPLCSNIVKDIAYAIGLAGKIPFQRGGRRVRFAICLVACGQPETSRHHIGLGTTECLLYTKCLHGGSCSPPKQTREVFTLGVVEVPTQGHIVKIQRSVKCP